MGYLDQFKGNPFKGVPAVQPVAPPATGPGPSQNARNAANLRAIKRAQDAERKRRMLAEKRRRDAEIKRKMIAEKRAQDQKNRENARKMRDKDQADKRTAREMKAEERRRRQDLENRLDKAKGKHDDAVDKAEAKQTQAEKMLTRAMRNKKAGEVLGDITDEAQRRIMEGVAKARNISPVARKRGIDATSQFYPDDYIVPKTQKQLDKWAEDHGIDPRRMTPQDVAESITWTGAPKATKDIDTVNRYLLPNPLRDVEGGPISFSKKHIREAAEGGPGSEPATKKQLEAIFGKKAGDKAFRRHNEKMERQVERFRNAAIDQFQARVENGDYVTMNQAVGELRRSDPDVVYGVQLMLQQTGYWDREKSGFGDVKPIDTPGDPRGKTLKWYKQFLQGALEQGGGYGARGGYGVMRFDKFIADAIESREASGVKVLGDVSEMGGGGGGGGYGGFGGGGGGGGAGAQVTLSDPNSVRTIANSIAQEILQRNLTDGEMNHIIEVVHQSEREQFVQEESGATEITDVDEEARIAAEIKALAPVESETSQVLNAFSALSEVISGRVQAGGITASKRY